MRNTAVPGGADSVAALANLAVVAHFLRDAWRHCKPLALAGGSASLLAVQLPSSTSLDRPGVAFGDAWLGVIEGDTVDATFLTAFAEALRVHRVWARQQPDPMPPIIRAQRSA